MTRVRLNLLSFVLSCFFVCAKVTGHDNVKSNETAKRESREIDSYIGMVSCAVRYDTACFLDAAEDYLAEKKTELLVQADAEAYRATGRSDPESRPSHLADVIGKLATELSKMFQGGLSGFFKSDAREADDDDDDGALEDGQSGTARANGATAAARGKKKKRKHDGLIKKIVRLVKLIIYALVLVIKIFAVVSLFNAFLKLKFLLVTIWALAFFGLKVYLTYKNGAEHVVHYEDVKHEHHYEEDDVPIVDWKPSSYADRLDYAQSLAYRKQKSSVSSSTNSPYFWF